VQRPVTDHPKGYVGPRWLLVGVTMLGCLSNDRDMDRGPVPGSAIVSLLETLSLADSLRIQEAPNALVVNPFVTSDENGGFLVADMSEGQVRQYGSDGHVEWIAGEKGWGPGELQLPAQVIRTGDDYLVIDGRRGLVKLRRIGDSVALTTLSTEIQRPFQAEYLGGDSVLIAGYRSPDHRTTLLHVLDLGTGMVRRSMVTMPGADVLAATALNAGVVSFVRIRDTVLVTVGSVDTVYSFLMSGKRVFALPLQSNNFVAPQVGPGRAPRQYWRQSFSRHFRLFALPGGRILVSHVRLWDGQYVWGTIIVTRDGHTAARCVAPRTDTGNTRQQHRIRWERGSRPVAFWEHTRVVVARYLVSGDSSCL